MADQPRPPPLFSFPEAVTAVASCLLATIYQCFNDLGFSYSPACGWAKVTVTVATKACLITVEWGGYHIDLCYRRLG